MRRDLALGLGVLACSLIGGFRDAVAQCTVPYQLTNGQTADASQVMADLNALLTCLHNAAPAGSPNALQYNAGSGAFGAVGPLTNGQVVIGSTGTAPQAAALTAGSGVTITNAPGSITIAATGGGGGGSGLYSGVLSATPTTTSTGLTSWLNQGSATVANSGAGVTLSSPSNGSTSLAGVMMAAPTPPYTITALLAVNGLPQNYISAGIGWYDGSSKLHTLYLGYGNGWATVIGQWNSPTGYNANEVAVGGTPLTWLRISDDGTNVSFAISIDGVNFVPLKTEAKSGAWLGATGYSNIIFEINAQGAGTSASLMSWTKS